MRKKAKNLITVLTLRYVIAFAKLLFGELGKLAPKAGG